MRTMFLLAALSFAVLAGCAKKEAAPEPIRAVRTVTVTSESAGGVHEFAGEIKAQTETRLSFRVGGKLLRRHVDLGEKVKPGQVLAELDPQDLRLSQEAARAALVAAQVNLDQAQADVKRYTELRDQGFISGAELERRETTLKAAQATMEQARAQASAQGNQTAYANLYAEAPGVVTAVDAEPGMVVAAGASVLRVALDGPRDVVFAVPEDKLAQFRAASAKPGGLTVRVWGEPGPALPAVVREVAAAADPATRTFLVKADLGKAPVRLGQTATALLELPRIEGVIKLPLSALMERQGQSVVWVLDGAAMTVDPHPVQVAGAEENMVVISGGLAPGQIVVTAGVHVLTPGQKVKQYVEPVVASNTPLPTASASAR